MSEGFICRRGGGGDIQLNFDVVNSSTEPSDPKENTIWVYQTWAQNGWSFGADMPLRRTKRTNKNFVVYPYYSSYRTVSGITFTDLTDGNTNKGKFLVNGTATSNVTFRASHDTAESGMFLLPAGKYTVSGCPAGGEADKTYAIQVNYRTDEGEWLRLAYETGSGANFTLTKDRVCNICFRVWNGATLNNLEVYFQIEKGSTATEFIAGNANGQIWVKPNDASPISFEALKRNKKNSGITLHPGEVYMYHENNGWRKQSQCKIYQNGAWKDLAIAWDGYFFKDGEQYTSVAGGWTSANWDNTGDVSIDSTITLSAPYSTPAKIAKVAVAQLVDLTNANTLWFDSPNGTNGKSIGGYLCVLREKDITSTNIVTSVGINRAGTGSVDVSGLSGKYYICLYAAGTTSASAYADVRAVWIE